MTELSPPLAAADRYVKLTRRKKALQAELKVVATELETIQQRVLDYIEEGALPESFRLDGAAVFTRAEIWASPLEGDHARLAEVLKDLGLVEYLPKNVNSQSLSAYVREHKDEETGEFDPDLIDPRLREVLKITITNKAVVNGA